MQTTDDVRPLPQIPPARPITKVSVDGYKAMLVSISRYSSQKRTIDPEEPHQVTPLEMVEDLVERTDLKASSKSGYRSALLWLLRSQGNQSESNRKAYAILEHDLKLTVAEANKKTNKARSISEEDLDDLISQLAENAEGSPWAARSQHWIQATLACGARPIEWMSAAWLDSTQTVLKIHTAKLKLSAPAFVKQEQGEGGSAADEDDIGEDEADESNGHYLAGATREIPITRSADRIAIDAHMAEFNHAVPSQLPDRDRLKAFKKYNDQCRQAVRRVCAQVWGTKKSFTMGTMRSQFSANQRALLGANASSILMGHSDPTSPAAAHYGKANQAHSRFKGVRQSMTNAEIAGNTDGEKARDVL